MSDDSGLSAARGRAAGIARGLLHGRMAYGLAAAGVAAATLVRSALDPTLGESAPYATYFAAAIALRTTLSHHRSHSAGDWGWSAVSSGSRQSRQRPACLVSRRRL